VGSVIPIITASARDIAKNHGVKLVEVSENRLDCTHLRAQTVALGSDHGSFTLKEKLRPTFEALGLHVREVAAIVARGEAARGVIIDHIFPGNLAALCYDRASTRNNRERNDSNVLTPGGRLLTANLAEDVLRVWLSTPFAGAARIQKITDSERDVKNWTPQS
jgi:ribose 5-phosphate isomerase B